MDEAASAIRRLLDGETVTSEPSGRYAFNELRHLPSPVQQRLPIMIGGSGEKKTLRSVARYADMWNAMGTVDEMRHKIDVLKQHCSDVGRDPAEITFTLGIKATIRDSVAEADRVWRSHMEHNRTPMADVEDDVTFWNGTPEQLAERLAPYVEMGFETVISEHPAPYDVESIERLIGQVKPLVDRG
jgi:alkanesulfonate monooxygenase SsuD/methylene tetrahydromethanopterin reductase-like flavin-dependent oxidoreductase (luciferase family)